MKDRSDAVRDEQPGSTGRPFCEALIGPLRGEIEESEKVRADFLKYKLLAVAALGSIGLGLKTTNDSTPLFNHIYILGIIPFVCFYVDLLCYHNTLRILVIGRYFANNGCPYEKFISQVGTALEKIEPSRKGASYLFELEDWALIYSTLLLSAFVMILGIVQYLASNCHCDYAMFALFVPGLLGIFLAVLSRKSFSHKKNVLFIVSENLNDGNREGSEP